MSNSKLVNYTKISPHKTSPRDHKIDKITIHHMAGNLTVETCGNVFQGSREASSNYGIGSDGRVGLYVEEKDRSWASANRANDMRAVTIEVANSKTGGDWPVSDKAYSKLIDLCVDICKRNGIEKLVYTGDARGNLTEHRMFMATGCPGEYLHKRMGEIAKAVNKKLAAPAAAASTTKQPIVDRAGCFSGAYDKTFTVTAKNALNVRAGAGTSKAKLGTLKHGAKVRCYGYYTKVGDTAWLYVTDGKLIGFCSGKYLK